MVSQVKNARPPGSTARCGLAEKTPIAGETTVTGPNVPFARFTRSIVRVGSSSSSQLMIAFPAPSTPTSGRLVSAPGGETVEVASRRPAAVRMRTPTRISPPTSCTNTIADRPSALVATAGSLARAAVTAAGALSVPSGSRVAAKTRPSLPRFQTMTALPVASTARSGASAIPPGPAEIGKGFVHAAGELAAGNTAIAATARIATTLARVRTDMAPAFVRGRGRPHPPPRAGGHKPGPASAVSR